jgi:hypothetical protein
LSNFTAPSCEHSSALPNEVSDDGAGDASTGADRSGCSGCMAIKEHAQEEAAQAGAHDPNEDKGKTYPFPQTKALLKLRPDPPQIRLQVQWRRNRLIH